MIGKPAGRNDNDTNRGKRDFEASDEMLESAMNGTFDETSYDETELSRLESRWNSILLPRDSWWDR